LTCICKLNSILVWVLFWKNVQSVKNTKHELAYETTRVFFPVPYRYILKMFLFSNRSYLSVLNNRVRCFLKRWNVHTLHCIEEIFRGFEHWVLNRKWMFHCNRVVLFIICNNCFRCKTYHKMTISIIYPVVTNCFLPGNIQRGYPDNFWIRHIKNSVFPG
jgi:hypothetical protein